MSSRLRTDAQLKALLRVMDRLDAGDAGVEIPFLGDPTETGRIAATLEGFRRRLTEAEEERRRAELASAAVRESEARYRMLAENTGDMVIQYDLEFRPLYVSPSVKSLGYEPDELLAEGIVGLVHPDDLATLKARREAVSQGLPLKAATGKMLAADGSWVWVESTMTPMFDAAGERVGYISTLRNIDERKLAEQALVDSEARYRMLAENVTDVLLRYGADSRVEYVSASVRQWGYEPADFIGKPAGTFVHPEDLQLIFDRRDAMIRGERTGPLEIRLLRADGTWTWIESNPAFIRGLDQEIIGVVLVLRDIDQRKQAEAALIDSEARYRMLADNVGDVLLRYDADLRVDYASPSIRQWGYTPEDFLGQPVGTFIHADDQERIGQRRAAMLRGERVPPGECRIRQADGSWVWTESTPALIRDENGAMLGIVLVLRDIDQRKQAETALVESEARYRMLAENIGDVLMRFDTSLNIGYVSPSVRQWGYAPEDFIGQPVDVFFHPDDLERIGQRRAALLRGERVPSGECRIRRADGNWIWTESNPAVIRDGEGAVLGVLLVLRDIDQRKQAETSLVDSEARYRMLAENIKDVMLRYDSDQRIEYVSPSVRQWGYAPEDFIGKPAGHFVHPEDQKRIAVRRAAMLKGETTPTVEARIRRADGTWTWVESSPGSIRGDNQSVIGVVLVLRDINRRKLAEAALIESESRYRMLADSVTDVMMRYDVDGRISYVSPSVRQWGYAQADWVGKAAGHLIHPDDKDRIAQRRESMLAGEEAPRAEVRILRGDGKWTWIESNPALIRDDDGAVVGVVLIMRDINERKLAELALIESEARYRILADNTSDIIQRFNADGIVEYISPSVRQLGYEPEFFIGGRTAQLVESEDLPDVVRRRQEILSGRPVAPLESRVRAADGRTVWLESRPSSIFDEQGKLVGVVNVMRDVTERKAAESALQELNLELRRVARASALGAFAASLAHEINQPLAAAAVNGEAALRWFTAEPANYERGLQATGRAVEAVRRAADVIGRLRALVTKEEPNRTLFDAHDALIEVLALTAREAERSSVTVHARLEAERPDILGDRVQFQQVIINLVLNAIEAMRNTEGERLLVIGSRDRAEGLELFVEDRGPGVEADKQGLIFESMFTTKIGGTGLGLAIAKSIVESHGGAIAMAPAEPHGAVFLVRLPRPAVKAGAGVRSA
jgi:PAS domain S-box-containing protein